MSKYREQYNQFVAIAQKAADFNNAAAVLSWDQEVNMPKKGFGFRGRQLATLAAHAHELLTSNEYGELLASLLNATELSEQEKANISLSFEDFEKQKKLPISFVNALSQLTTECYQKWIEARRANDFSLFQDSLQQMIEMKRQQADLYGFSQHPYDALLDEYERGATVAILNPIFHQLSLDLPELLKKISSQPQVENKIFQQYFPKERQFRCSMELLQTLGYDFDGGRQDYAEHPFSISFAPTDSRITTRVDEHDLASLFWSSIHECGHALYEQGLPESQYGLPLGAAVSLSIHESQSRLWENCVGRSLPFMTYFNSLLHQYFPAQMQGVESFQLFQAANKVEPSFIRTESDELTYHFHVMIRYEIEKQLIEGAIEAKDIPELWSSLYQHYLGIKPPSHNLGALQDVHWSHGSFGYFPTYSLGSFYAAQFYEKAKQSIPDLETKIAQGDFKLLLQWLRDNIHQFGRQFSSEALCEKVTGKPLDVGVFLKYADIKYRSIYCF